MTLYISRKAKIKLNLRVYYEDAKRILLCVILFLSVVAISLAAVCIYLNSRFQRVQIEAGDGLDAEELFGDGAYFGDDYEPEWTDRAGVYYFTAVASEGEIRVRLSVKDTKAPEVKLRDAYFAVGGDFPTPMDYIESVYEPDSFGGEYLTDLPKLTSPGEYEMQVRYTDASGNKTEVFKVKMIQIYDSEPPKAEVSPLIVCPKGGTVEYKPHVSISDNCTGKLSFEVDESGLDLSECGEYTVYLRGIDAVGNKSSRYPITVSVVEAFDGRVLDDMLSDIVDDISPENKSREEIVREIYKLVRKELTYTADSEKGDVERAAYYALAGGGGDCYSYFSLSKLLLDLCGIENLDIQRAEGYTEDTHYWSLVNIGEGDDELWYHLDTTELRADRYDHSGCLLTEKQINAYSRARADFYRYDKRDYPSAAEQIITPTPRLEELY